MDTLTKLQNMTHEELVAHALNLETQKTNLVYGIGKEDLVYVLSSMLSIPESFISKELVEKASELMQSRFCFDEETTQIINFLEAQQMDWNVATATFTGYVDAYGTVHIAHAAPGQLDEDNFKEIKGDANTSLFLKHVLGADWFNKVQESPHFTFEREAIENIAM